MQLNYQNYNRMYTYTNTPNKIKNTNITTPNHNNDYQEHGCNETTNYTNQHTHTS